MFKQVVAWFFEYFANLDDRAIDWIKPTEMYSEISFLRTRIWVGLNFDSVKSINLR